MNTPVRGVGELHHGSNYEPDEDEFLRAVDAWRLSRRKGEPIRLTEVFALMLRLGYRKDAAPLPPEQTDFERVRDAVLQERELCAGIAEAAGTKCAALAVQARDAGDAEAQRYWLAKADGCQVVGNSVRRLGEPD